MNQDVELLNYIYQNSQMGVLTISKLLEMISEGEFKNQLSSQLSEYTMIHTVAKDLLNKNGYDEKGINAFEKLRTYLMLNMQILKDKSISHIAEMLIIGSNMGVIDAIKNIKKCKNANPEIVELMHKLKTFEENNITILKKYL